MKEKRPWSNEETQGLLEGVNKYGVGKWKEILGDGTWEFNGRDTVNLKDKWRNICIKNDKENSKHQRKQMPSDRESKDVAIVDNSIMSSNHIISINKNYLVDLSPEQQTVLHYVMEGKNVFFTGSAGTGKSHLLRRLMEILNPDTTYITASTGVAACHLNGVTIHSFSGIGFGDKPMEELIKKACFGEVAWRWRNCRVLIVDEISMLDGWYFDRLEVVARMVRKNDRPFGGIQLIICGDFFQLPPINKNGATDVQFCFEMEAWEKCIDVVVELKTIFRQSDKKFTQLLERLRVGDTTKEDHAFLFKKTTMVPLSNDMDILPTCLFPTRRECNEMNQFFLDKLDGCERIYRAEEEGEDEYRLEMERNCPGVSTLILKLNAQVILVKNISISLGLANGTRGIVIDFIPEHAKQSHFVQKDTSHHFTDIVYYPLVRFMNGCERVIMPERWSIVLGARTVYVRKQIPLQLAWALSIHKCQGMTLDFYQISLSKVFEYGQAYVALSRARSLNHVYIKDFIKDSLNAHPRVLEYFKGGNANKNSHNIKSESSLEECRTTHSQQPLSNKHRSSSYIWDSQNSLPTCEHCSTLFVKGTVKKVGPTQGRPFITCPNGSQLNLRCNQRFYWLST